MSVSLILYSTLGCHLCDDAKRLISSQSTFVVALEEVDIASSETLVEVYGIRIPVLKLKSNEQELGWPFDQAQLLEFLSKA